MRPIRVERVIVADAPMRRCADAPITGSAYA